MKKNKFFIILLLFLLIPYNIKAYNQVIEPTIVGGTSNPIVNIEWYNTSLNKLFTETPTGSGIGVDTYNWFKNELIGNQGYLNWSSKYFINGNLGGSCTNVYFFYGEYNNTWLQIDSINEWGETIFKFNSSAEGFNVDKTLFCYAGVDYGSTEITTDETFTWYPNNVAYSFSSIEDLKFSSSYYNTLALYYAESEEFFTWNKDDIFLRSVDNSYELAMGSALPSFLDDYELLNDRIKTDFGNVYGFEGIIFNNPLANLTNIDIIMTYSDKIAYNVSFNKYNYTTGTYTTDDWVGTTTISQNESNFGWLYVPMKIDYTNKILPYITFKTYEIDSNMKIYIKKDIDYTLTLVSDNDTTINLVDNNNDPIVVNNIGNGQNISDNVNGIFNNINLFLTNQNEGLVAIRTQLDNFIGAMSESTQALLLIMYTLSWVIVLWKVGRS